MSAMNFSDIKPINPEALYSLYLEMMTAGCKKEENLTLVASKSLFFLQMQMTSFYSNQRFVFFKPLPIEGAPQGERPMTFAHVRHVGLFLSLFQRSLHLFQAPSLVSSDRNPDKQKDKPISTKFAALFAEIAKSMGSPAMPSVQIKPQIPTQLPMNFLVPFESKFSISKSYGKGSKKEREKNPDHEESEEELS
jgi:hypothetical protein